MGTSLTHCREPSRDVLSTLERLTWTESSVRVGTRLATPPLPLRYTTNRSGPRARGRNQDPVLQSRLGGPRVPRRGRVFRSEDTTLPSFLSVSSVSRPSTMSGEGSDLESRGKYITTCCYSTQSKISPDPGTPESSRPTASTL